MANGPRLVILAGGKSSRLWPFEDKSLIEFLGEPLFLRQLRTYLELGLTDVSIITNPNNAERLRSLAESCRGISAEVLVQREPKGMGDALLQLKNRVQQEASRPIYISQVHDLFDTDFHRAILEANERGLADSLLAAQEVTAYFPGGYLMLGSSGRVTGIVEKPGAGNEPSNLVTLVAHLHRNPSELIAAIEEEYDKVAGSDDHYERAMAHLMQHRVFRAIPYRGQSRSIKYPWHVLDAMDFILAQIKEPRIDPDAKITASANIKGPVVIESGARVFDGAAVVGPAYIGAGTIIGNNALVRESMIGQRCVVGYSTEVARSYVANDVWFHTNYVGDSAIDSNVSFGSGAITANLRLDERSVRSTIRGQRVDTGRVKLGAMVGSGTRIGVNTLLMPGVKIGVGSLVGPGVVMNEDVPDHTQVLVKQELEIRQSGVDAQAGDRDRFRTGLGSHSDGSR
jgi:bifunctional UDP-N-acetylglucosamine pyrophosphorylase/glucosamine-1-phosphate N-acetyltransferase